MLALRIVEHFYVIKHVVAGFCASLVGPAPDPLAFEQVEEAFGHTRAPCSNSLPDGRSVFESRRPETDFIFLLSVFMISDGLFQRIDTEVCMHRIRHPPAQHLARCPVHDGDEVEITPADGE